MTDTPQITLELQGRQRRLLQDLMSIERRQQTLIFRRGTNRGVAVDQDVAALAWQWLEYHRSLRLHLLLGIYEDWFIDYLRERARRIRRERNKEAP